MPAVQFRYLQAERAEDGTDLGAMVVAVVDRLEEEERFGVRDVGFLAATRQGDVQFIRTIEERPPVLRLLLEGGAKLIEPDRDGLVYLLVGGRPTNHRREVALFGGDEMNERRGDRAVGAGDGGALNVRG